jgi:preprotein translocase subunit YajC
MRGADRVILIALPVAALLAGFWFLVISPKREEANELQASIETLQASIDQNEQQIATAEAARADFPRNYAQLVKLGSAVPEDDDQATLIHDLAELGSKNDVEFREFELVPGSETPAPTPAPTPTASAADESEERVDNAISEEPAIATEADVATLPIGASAGPAGLPIMPYQFKFLGNFFHVADFFADLDERVSTRKGKPVVDGRLLTVNGFALTGDSRSGFPSVEANFSVTTFIVPPEQGLAAGATPAGPDPSGIPGAEATPVAAPASEVSP